MCFIYWLRNQNFHLQDEEAYAYLLNVLVPEFSGLGTLNVKDHSERANMVLALADKLDCKRYITPKDIVEGSPNFNFAFVAQIFQHGRETSFSSSCLFHTKPFLAILKCLINNAWPTCSLCKCMYLLLCLCLFSLILKMLFHLDKHQNANRLITYDRQHTGTLLVPFHYVILFSFFPNLLFVRCPRLLITLCSSVPSPFYGVKSSNSLGVYRETIKMWDTGVSVVV